MKKQQWHQGFKAKHSDDIFRPDTIYDDTDDSICLVYGVPSNARLSEIQDESRWQKGLQNARLIADAPDMLDVLEWLDKQGGLGYEKHEQIRAVIARAKGKRSGGG